MTLSTLLMLPWLLQRAQKHIHTHSTHWNNITPHFPHSVQDPRPGHNRTPKQLWPYLFTCCPNQDNPPISYKTTTTARICITKALKRLRLLLPYHRRFWTQSTEAIMTLSPTWAKWIYPKCVSITGFERVLHRASTFTHNNIEIYIIISTSLQISQLEIIWEFQCHNGLQTNGMALRRIQRHRRMQIGYEYYQKGQELGLVRLPKILILRSSLRTKPEKLLRWISWSVIFTAFYKWAFEEKLSFWLAIL